MRIIYFKGWLVKLTCIVLGIVIWVSVSKLKVVNVYKDRELWEKIGAIVWEVKVREKDIALTFDDGPSPTFTDEILDLLCQYHAHATFFVIGKEAEKHPDIILREIATGNEIGNHTYQHHEVNQMNSEELLSDLEYAHQVIYKITHKTMKLFRPTSGFYNEKIVHVAQLLNYTVVIWTWGQDSRDWTGINGERIAQQIIKTVKPGDIILFHDRGGDHSNTVRALEMLLPVLIGEGYHFLTVSDLLQKAVIFNSQSAK